MKLLAQISMKLKAIGKDSRIGSKFLKPGPGFEEIVLKDILNLVYLCRYYGLKRLGIIGSR